MIELLFNLLTAAAITWQSYKVICIRQYYMLDCLVTESQLTFDQRSIAEKRVIWADSAYFGYLILGALFAVDWWIFLLILIKKFIPNKSKTVTWISALSQALLLLFAVANTYIFKIDLIKILFHG